MSLKFLINIAFVLAQASLVILIMRKEVGDVFVDGHLTIVFIPRNFVYKDCEGRGRYSGE